MRLPTRALALALLLSPAGLVPAAAAASPTSGVVYVWVTPGSGASSSVVLTGAIGDYGKGVSMDKNGKVDPNGGYVRVTLQRGSFIVNSVALDQKSNTAKPRLNQKTCSFQLSVTGNITLSGGTGAYQGIRGQLLVTAQFAGVSPRQKNGACGFSDRTGPLASWAAITGRGPVTYGSSS